jgi:hypothetical protein
LFEHRFANLALCTVNLFRVELEAHPGWE